MTRSDRRGAKRTRMSALRAAWTALGLAVVVGAATQCGGASSAVGAGDGCGVNQMRCSACSGGSFCSASCPSIACPVVDADAGALPNDAGNDCPATMPVLCHDCSGGLFCVAGACGGMTCFAGDAATVQDTNPEGGSLTDAGSCGLCASGRVCVHPWNCGGNAPSCEPAQDAAACESGWTFSLSCLGPSGAQGPGCEPPPCVNPPPSCMTLPAACDGTATCGCAASLCDSVCSTVSNGEVFCGGA